MIEQRIKQDPSDGRSRAKWGRLESPSEIRADARGVWRLGGHMGKEALEGENPAAAVDRLAQL